MYVSNDIVWENFVLTFTDRETTTTFTRTKTVMSIYSFTFLYHIGVNIIHMITEKIMLSNDLYRAINGV